MTEAEWLTYDDPMLMLSWLTGRVGGLPFGEYHIAHPQTPVSNRKLRLFTCACCRLAGGDCCKPGGSIDGAEDFADGKSVLPGAWATDLDAFEQLRTIAVQMQLQEQPQNCAALLREVVGNPWHSIIISDPCIECEGNRGWHDFAGVWSTCHHCKKMGRIGKPWLTPSILSIAQRIYDERDWDAMPILADALEEAGCSEEELLQHCRGQEYCYSHDPAKPCDLCGDKMTVPLRGPHVRGCWALDMILGLT